MPTQPFKFLRPKETGMPTAAIAVTCLMMLAAGAAISSTGGDKKNVVISLCDISHPSDAKIEWKCYKRPLGKSPRQLWGDKWVDVLRFNRLDRLHFPEVNSLKVPVRLEDLHKFTPLPSSYPPAEKEDKFILIDQTEQYLGAYKKGKLAFSAPITVGDVGTRTPRGTFRITVVDRDHKSTQYKLPGSKEPYPMRHALMFFQDEEGLQYWIHGRDMPGYPGSHGCIGLYDETMEKNYMGEPGGSDLQDAKKLFDWVTEGRKELAGYVEGYRDIRDGPKVEIKGKPPKVKFRQKK